MSTSRSVHVAVDTNKETRLLAGGAEGLVYCLPYSDKSSDSIKKLTLNNPGFIAVKDLHLPSDDESIGIGEYLFDITIQEPKKFNALHFTPSLYVPRISIRPDEQTQKFTLVPNENGIGCILLPYIGFNESPHNSFSLESYLRNKVRSKKIITAEEFADITVSLIQSVNAFHAEGVFHGDLSCRNILVQSPTSLVITDLGRAKFIRPGGFFRGESTGVGPLRWMSQERMLAEVTGSKKLPSLTIQSEQFAIQATILEMLGQSLGYESKYVLGGYPGEPEDKMVSTVSVNSNDELLKKIY